MRNAQMLGYTKIREIALNWASFRNIPFCNMYPRYSRYRETYNEREVAADGPKYVQCMETTIRKYRYSSNHYVGC